MTMLIQLAGGVRDVKFTMKKILRVRVITTYASPSSL